MLPSVVACGVVAAQGVRFVVVGSCALFLAGDMAVLPVKDADIVPDPSPQNLDCLWEALTDMAVTAWRVPPRGRLGTLDVVPVATVYGKVDCLLERGRADFDDLLSRASLAPVTDAEVAVASEADCRRLRSLYKGR